MNMQPVHVSASRGVAVVPASEAVVNLFPSAPTITVQGNRLAVVPHQPVETFMLRKMGFDVPSPILTHYDWAGGTPFDVQKQTCALLTMNKSAYVLNGLGTGKTKAALWAWDYLRTHGMAQKLLVLAPLSTLYFTWGREVFNTLPHRKYVVLHGTKAKRLERLADPEAEIFIINHDGYRTIAKELAERSDINALVIDELAVYRSGKAERTKAAMKLAERMEWKWGLTGAPTPHEPTDVWAQARIITPHTVPKYFGKFRDQLMTKVTQFRFVPKADAVERAFLALQPAVRFTLDDVVELPELVERTIDVALGPKQEAVYKQLADKAYAAVAANEITAANAGAVMSKLLQVSAGWVYTGDGTTIPLDNDKRIEALIDAINGTSNKVLVFAPFKHALAGIGEALTREQIEYATVSGDTPAGQRAEIFNLFQNTQKYRVLNAHPQCLAHGITLTAADTIIWFAPITSLETYDQANFRIRRVGQKHKQLILHLQGTKVERRIYALLRQRQSVQEKLLDLFEDASERIVEGVATAMGVAA